MGLHNRLGEIVLFSFCSDNSKSAKVQHGVILHDHSNDGNDQDLTVACITSEIEKYVDSPYSLVIENKDLQFGDLEGKSLICVNKLVTVDSSACKRANVAKLNHEMIQNLIKLATKALVVTYYQAIHRPVQNAPFIPEQTRINYAGRVFDEAEMVYLVDSSLDFWLTSGRYSQKFEMDFAQKLGVRHCSLVNSGSSANLLAMMAITSPKLGARRLHPGDEVITVAAGFPTTVAPILQARAVPVFVDVLLPDANVDVNLLEQAFSPKTKAVMLAHTLGFPFDLRAVKAFCDFHDLWLIEDNCDALGSRVMIEDKWHYTGTIGHLGTSSFYPPHHITMGEGGAVYTNDPTLKRIVESFRDWGRDCWCASGQDNSCKHRFDQQFGSLPLGYDHKYVYSHFGYNLKATDLQAAIGCAQLEKIDQFTAKRMDNFLRLQRGVQHLSHVFYMPEIACNTIPSPFGFLLTVKKEASFIRNNVTNFLESRNIQTRNLFAGNITRHPCFDYLEKDKDYRIVGELNTTDLIMKNSFWIGVYPGMTNDMIEYMIQSLSEFVEDT